MMQRGNPTEPHKEAEASQSQFARNDGEPKRSFPFLSTPSGNLKIEPKQVVFESKKVSVLVADPMHTKVNIKADLDGLEMGDEFSDHSINKKDNKIKQMLPLQSNVLSQCMHKHQWTAEELCTTFEGCGDCETNFNLEMLNTYSPEIIDWNKINLPPKSELFKLLLYRITNAIKPDCKVVIGGEQIKCHSIVLQSYSMYFDDKDLGEQYELPKEHVSAKAFITVYKWMIYPDPESHRLLNKENILEIFKAAQYLGIKELEEQCWTFIDCEDLFSEESAFRMFLKARRYGMHAITELMVPRIMDFFLTLVSSRNFLHLDVEDLCTILHSNYIAVHCELEVFMSAVRWLTYDWENREKDVVDVMRCIRFGLLLPCQLVDIRRNPKNPEFIAIASRPEVQKMVDDGLEFAIVKYWHGNNQEEFNIWCNKLGMDVPGPRNWIGEDKKYATYQEFLQDLESYRRNVFEGRSGDQIVHGDHRSPRLEPPIMPSTRSDLMRAARTYAMVESPPSQQQQPQQPQPDRAPLRVVHSEPAGAGTDTSTSTAAAGVSTLGSESTPDGQPPPPPPMAEGLQLHVPRRTAPLHELTRRLSASLLGPVTRDYLVEGSLFLPQSESVLVVGGADPTGQPAPGQAFGRDVLRLRLDAGCWERAAELPEPRHHHAVAFLKGHVYVAGGRDPRDSSARHRGSVSSAVWSLEPASRTWSAEPDMLAARQSFALVPCGGRLFAIGGQDRSGKVLRSVERFNPVSGVWEYVAPMREARMGLAAAQFRGLIWVAGGMTGERTHTLTSSVECYDPRANVWSVSAPLRQPLCFGRMLCLQDTLFLAGGATRAARDSIIGSVDSVDVWDPTQGRWCVRAKLAVPRHGHALGYVGTHLLVAGGLTTLYVRALSAVEALCCEAGSRVRSVPDLPEAIAGHDIATLPPASLM